MRIKESHTTIVVSKDTNRDLKQVKLDLNYPSVDALINMFMEEWKSKR